MIYQLIHAGKFINLTFRNAVHASSDVDAGKREISIWFSKDEVIEWKPTNNTWIYE